MPKIEKAQLSNCLVSTTSAAGSNARSSVWSSKDDEVLIQARSQGLNWNQIAPKQFPSKSPNACRKRHERLMELQNAEQWGGVKLEILAQTYMDCRREIWSILSDRLGEKWTTIEQKCMEKGLKNLNQAYRSSQKKQGRYEDQNAEQWDGVKLGTLAQTYMDCRREIWSILAARLGEKWTTIEQKCMEKGLKNLNQAYRSSQKKQGRYEDQNEDSGIGFLTDEDRDDHIYLTGVPEASPYTPIEQTRVPSIESMLNYPNSSLQPQPLHAQTLRQQLLPLQRPYKYYSFPEDPDQLKKTSAQRPKPHTYQPEINCEISCLDDKNETNHEVIPPHFPKTVTMDDRFPVNPQQSTLSPVHTLFRSSQVPGTEIIVLDIDLRTEKSAKIEASLEDIWEPSLRRLDDSNETSEIHPNHLEERNTYHSTPTETCNITRPCLLVNPRLSNVSLPIGVIEHSDSSESITADSLSDTSSNFSGDGELRTQKEQMLDRLMLRFHDIMNSAGVSCGWNSSTTNAPDLPAHQASSSSRQGTASESSGKRKADSRRGNDEDENEDGSSRKRPKREQGTPESDAENKKKLACPYFKHNPLKYQNYRGCSGPGWNTVHRIKEHLYRRHALPPHCPRCYQTFNNEPDVSNHIRTQDRCELQEQVAPEGLTKSQTEELKRKKLMFQAEGEGQKWNIVYQIIFRDTPSSELPSPYYDHEPITALPNNSSPDPPDLIQYKAYLSRELPRSVRKELELAMERFLGPIEETLKNQLENIVRDCQERLSREYQQIAQSSVHIPAAPSGTEQNLPPQNVSALTSNSDLVNRMLLPNTLDVLAQYNVPADSSLNLWTGCELLPYTNHATSSDPEFYSEMQSSSMGFAHDASTMGLSMGLGPIERSGYTLELNYTPQSTISGDAVWYAGKGKEKAASDNVDTQWLDRYEHQ